MARMQFSLDGAWCRRLRARVSPLAQAPIALGVLATAFTAALFSRFRIFPACYRAQPIAVLELAASTRPSFCLPFYRQRGVSLLEVMIAVLVLAVGILGAASLQLNAIRYSASAGHSTQASLIASDLLDRMRANSVALENYAISVEGDCTRSSAGGNIALRDLADFTEAITCYLPGSAGTIVVSSGGLATVSISWSEARTVADAQDTRFVVSSVVR